MKKYRLIVDSSCDLPYEYYEKFDLGVTDLIVNIGERSYRDRKDITADEILKIYKEKNVLPKTSALNIADLSDVFSENLKEYEHIFYMPISSGISSIFNNARLASLEFEGRVTVLDSTQLSSGVGLLAIGILRDMALDKSVEEIVNNFNEKVKCVQMQFVIDTMEFLYKGGRCSGLTFLLGNKLHLHPIIKLDKGLMSVYKLKRGNIIKGVEQMADEFIEQLNKGNIDLSYPIFFPNVVSPSGVKKMTDLLKEHVGEKILFPVDASGIITCHCGANTIGLAYMTKEPITK